MNNLVFWRSHVIFSILGSRDFSLQRDQCIQYRVSKTQVVTRSVRVEYEERVCKERRPLCSR